MKTSVMWTCWLVAGLAGGCGSSGNGSSSIADGGSRSDGGPGITSSGSGGSSSSGSGSSSGSSSSGSGSGSSSGGSNDAGSGGDGAGSSSGGSSSGGIDPTHLPSATGACPTFASGVVTVAAGGGTIQAQTWMGSTGGGPLIIYWHATGSSATYEVPLAFDTAAVTAAGGMIVGFESTTRAGAAPTNTTGNDVWYQSDVAFADQVVACAIQQVHVDPRHIHAAGYSAGALQSVYMWFARSGYVASVVSYSGGDVTIDEAPFQDPAHVGAALVAHGGSGVDLYGTTDFAMTSAAWETQIKQAGALAIDCNDSQAHVYLMRLSNLAPVSLEFFQDHPFGVKPEPYTTLPTGFPSYCTIQ